MACKTVHIGTMIICPICNGKFIKSYNTQVYCTKQCSKKAQRLQVKEFKRRANSNYVSVGEKITCANPKCDVKFIKKSASHRYCCADCREEAKGYTQPKKTRFRSLSEVLQRMKEMGYAKSYGKFCIEHPEELVKEA